MSRLPAFRPAARSGFSLAELLIALLLTAVVGAAVTGLFVSQSRFFEQQEKEGFARGVSRGAMNIVMSELRMIDQDSGIVLANDSVIQMRVPYAMGLVCDTVGVLTVALFPAEDIIGDTVYGGYAWRDTTGFYQYRDETGTPPAPLGLNVLCTAQNITAAAANVYALVPSAPANIGAPVMLYQYVTYSFAQDAGTGRRGLFRQVAGEAPELLVAPFDTTAAFRFFWGSESGDAQATVHPDSLESVHGVQLVLDGVSERPEADGTFRRVPLTTEVFFKNRRQ